MKKSTQSLRASTRQELTPVLHFRLQREVHTALKLQAAAERRAMYRVVEDALTAYLTHCNRRRPHK